MIHFLGSALAVATALVVAAPACAQGFVPAPTPTADALAEQMRTLATDPRNAAALVTAGELSTRLGDYEAANAFFARAEAIDPRSPRLMAARATLLVQLERPGEALRLWDAAERGGVAIAPYLPARGLAWDLVGQPAAAQRDYRRALLADRDDETVRRLALSLGIAGQDAEALTLLDPLVRRGDRAAWRARAFVLAMAGQQAEAERIASASVVGGAQMGPLLAMLRGLRPADRAFAVHFGAPGATPLRLADARVAPLPTGVAVVAAPAPAPGPVASIPIQVATLAPPPVTRAAAPFTGRVADAPAPAAGPAVPSGTSMMAVAPAPTPAAPPTQPAPTTTVGAVTSADVTPPRSEPVVAAAPIPTAPIPVPAPPAAAVAVTPLVTAPPQPIAATPAVGGWSLAPKAPTPVRTAEVARRNTRLLAAVISGIDVPASELGVAPPARPVAAKVAAKAPAKTKPEPKKPDPAKANPQRWWVQVAGGANAGDLAKEWRRVSAKAPAAFRGKSAWTTPLRATNRLLAGPFASQDAAMGFVNALKKEDVAAFAWQSPAGQAIDALETR